MRENAPPPSGTAIQQDGVITQKTSPPCFFTFYPGVPGTLSYYYDQNTWTAHRLPTLTLTGKEKQMLLVAKCISLLFLSCITPNWRSCETANGGLGPEVQMRAEILEPPRLVASNISLGLANDSEKAVMR